jgi:hypothetical protein
MRIERLQAFAVWVRNAFRVAGQKSHDRIVVGSHVKPVALFYLHVFYSGREFENTPPFVLVDRAVLRTNPA